ncbi:MAG TPA: tRNA lysidine(34) synthetase TilS [Spirochaetia bacterium]|nr:tRNA lysidine(34) synthetase TilS [Spirochaetales bacterium]HQK33367.1 tRNA lysidine(34) synthetase TilS [Spirochaetales bacterium]HRS65289.1 tRNA lysidine(34) synthetase TilS [Spirochaetia bacterium]
MKQTIDEIVQLFFSRRAVHSLLVAYSGGPDSAVLVHALWRLNNANRFCTLKACWINHALRPAQEMVEEQRLVERFIHSLGIPLTIVTAKTGEIEAYQRDLGVSGGIEAAARAFRYKKLHEVAEREHCEVIATAHTQSDVIETLIMRFFTGSGIDGLCGIPEEQGCIVRPLLTVTRSDILEYISRWNIPVSHDSTNQETVYLRNKVRHMLVPVIREIFPSVNASLTTVQKKAQCDAVALTAYAEHLLLAREGVTVIDAEGFKKSPLAVQIRALYLLVRQHKKRIPWETMKILAETIVQKGQASIGGYQFISTDSCIRIVQNDTEQQKDQTEYMFSCVVDKPGCFQLTNKYVLEIQFTHDTSGIRIDACTMPFIVRSRRNGDAILMKEGHKAVDAIVASWNLSREQEQLVLIVEDSDGIIAVWGAHIAKTVVFRHNPNLANSDTNDYITITMKGVDNE